MLRTLSATDITKVISLHLIQSLVSLMVELGPYTAVAVVRFHHEAPCNFSKCGHCGSLKSYGTWFDPRRLHQMLCPGGGTGIRTSLKRKKEKHLVVSSNLIPGTTQWSR